MIYQFLLAMAIAVWVIPKVIAFLLATINYPFLGPYLLSSLSHTYPGGIPGLGLLLLRVSVGGLFLIHGYPKVLHLRRWAESINTPVFLCSISAWSMLGGGFLLIIGLLTLLATLPILASMLFAILLHLDVRCFVIPADDLTTWDEMTEEVASLIEIELEKVPRSSVYLCAESFGGCLALKVLEKFPHLFTKIILINSASSFHRLPWLNLGSLLFPYTPNFFYKISSLISLPFLANLTRISPDAKKALLHSTHSAPKPTANQRLCLMREFEINQPKLTQITQPVLFVNRQ